MENKNASVISAVKPAPVAAVAAVKPATTVAASPVRPATPLKAVQTAKPAAKKEKKIVKRKAKAAAKPAAKPQERTSARPSASASSASSKSATAAFTKAWSSAPSFGKEFSGVGKDAAAQLAKSAQNAADNLNEVFALGQEAMEACVESSNIAASLSKTVGEELFEFNNQLFSKNVDLSKQLFACRTINDMFELQSKAMKANIDRIFNETAKLSEMTFKMASKMSDPINQHANEATKRLSKLASA